ncbi:MAG: hypothetical protein ACRCZ7_02835 [Aeromonas sobria]
MARCYFEATKIDIDQQKPGLKSKVNGAMCFMLFKERISKMRLNTGGQRGFAYHKVHNAQQHKNAFKYERLKD